MQSESRYHYLNDVNYFFKYSEEVVATITNVVIPYVSQFEYYSDENHFNRIIQILLEADQTYEDIYYSLGVYLLSQTEEVEEKMNTVRTILCNLQRADEAVAQRVLNIMNVLIPPTPKQTLLETLLASKSCNKCKISSELFPMKNWQNCRLLRFPNYRRMKKVVRFAWTSFSGVPVVYYSVQASFS